MIEMETMDQWNTLVTLWQSWDPTFIVYIIFVAPIEKKLIKLRVKNKTNDSVQIISLFLFGNYHQTCSAPKWWHSYQMMFNFSLSLTWINLFACLLKILVFLINCGKIAKGILKSRFSVCTREKNTFDKWGHMMLL